MIIIFNNNKNKIKEIIDNKLILSIYILNIDGNYREKQLELIRKKQNTNDLIDNLFKQINELKEKNTNLENELNNIKLENNNIKENFNKFKNDITQEINELKNKIKKAESNSFKIDSKIINNKKIMILY